MKKNFFLLLVLLNLPGFAQVPVLLNPAVFVGDGFRRRHCDGHVVASSINTAGLFFPGPSRILAG
ncbi:MAG: hypothetical protein H6559_01260 [Lewinellaceae bacterium]|nr:hypothetical protein [Lewinellaceae bacterium]